MHDEYPWFENAIRALELTLKGRKITIVDNQGLFHTPAGKLIFPLARQSHRKHPVCDCGFSSRCIDFCRHAMNRECQRRKAAFAKTCWKGVREIVVPLRHGDQHWGMAYLGAWKTREGAPEGRGELPPEFASRYEALPLWSPAVFRKFAPLLEAFAAGLVARLAELNAVELRAPDPAERIRGYLSRSAKFPGAGVAGLARELHLSASHTSRLVRRYFGCGFPELLREERIRRSKVLLLSTGDKLAAIAAATGFGDEYHFSRVFRKLTGAPPGRFRRENL